MSTTPENDHCGQEYDTIKHIVSTPNGPGIYHFLMFYVYLLICILYSILFLVIIYIFLKSRK